MLIGVLISSAARAGSARELGRLAFRAAIYFEMMTAVALLTGWAAVAIVQPSRALHFTNGSPDNTVQVPAAADLVTAAFPTSLIDAMARGDVLQIVIFTGLFGAGCASIGGAKAGPVTALAESLAAVAFQYTRFITYAAPLAVFARMAVTVSTNGSTALGGLARFVVTAYRR